MRRAPPLSACQRALRAEREAGRPLAAREGQNGDSAGPKTASPLSRPPSQPLPAPVGPYRAELLAKSYRHFVVILGSEEKGETLTGTRHLVLGRGPAGLSISLVMLDLLDQDSFCSFKAHIKHTHLKTTSLRDSVIQALGFCLKLKIL